MRRKTKNIVRMPRHIFMGHDFLLEEINEDMHFVGQSMVSEIFDYMRNSEEHMGKKLNWRCLFPHILNNWSHVNRGDGLRRQRCMWEYKFKNKFETPQHIVFFLTRWTLRNWPKEMLVWEKMWTEHGRK